MEYVLTDEVKQNISDSASKIKKGIFLFFNSEEFSLGAEYNWVTNPLNGFNYPPNIHWSKINDYNSESGDIKFVWEKSRFSFLYSLIRDEEINGSNHKEFIFYQISDWIDANPVNQGPNWKCSQEISIRVLNWIFALYYYSNKGLINEDLWQKILNSIFQQISHVKKHINFSRIAVRNNHAITESLTLYIVGLLFPWLDENGEWKRKGKIWFEEEVGYQIYSDGTFLQFSMNYHRVVIQLLTKAIVAAELNGEKFSTIVYDRAYKSVNFLYQCQNIDDGNLPNYGANDGALFFPLNSCKYRDFRPQLNALHFVLTGESLYNNGVWMEDARWLTSNNKFKHKKFKKLTQIQGLIKFENGGYYLIREKETLTFLRAGSHKDRPSQADNLHIDIWYKSKNYLMDGGSYKYNDIDKNIVRYFIGTQSHNSVMLNQKDQMLKGDRFVWFNWTQLNNINFSETDEYFKIDATIHAFLDLDKNCKHRRIIVKVKGNPSWVVEDYIYSDKPIEMNQIWNTTDDYLKKIHFYSETRNKLVLDLKIKEGWYSSEYGVKKASKQITFFTREKYIRTMFSIND
jgi:hypothetical protein